MRENTRAFITGILCFAIASGILGFVTKTAQYRAEVAPAPVTQDLFGLLGISGIYVATNTAPVLPQDEPSPSPVVALAPWVKPTQPVVVPAKTPVQVPQSTKPVQPSIPPVHQTLPLQPSPAVPVPQLQPPVQIPTLPVVVTPTQPPTPAPVQIPPQTPVVTPTPAPAPTPVPTPQVSAPLSSGFGISVSSSLFSLTDAQLATRLDDMVSLGVTWIRMDMSWSTIQPSETGALRWTNIDRIVDAARARNIHILGLLTDSPSWAREGNCTSARCQPREPADFAYFAGEAAKRYSPKGVHAWEVWNEPNITLFWRPAPNPDRYTDLLRLSYKAIKAKDSAAVVISGGLSPAANENGNIAPIDFLSRIYDFNAGPYFDAVGFHPYSFPATAAVFQKWNAWSQMAETNPSLRSVMTEHGDAAKQIWMTEYGAPTGGPGIVATLDNYKTIKNSTHVDEALQARTLSDAIAAARQHSWSGPLIWYSYKDLGTSGDTIENFFGLVRYDGTHKPSYTLLKDLF